MKYIVFFISALSLFGCAQTMKIDDLKFGEERASLKIDASDLEGYVSIPLINYKVVGVSLSEFPECMDGEPVADRGKHLGNATLTPKAYTQTVIIPASKKILILTSSEENAGGNMYTCRNAIHFSPRDKVDYILNVTPHGKSHQCSARVFEVVDGEVVPSDDAKYPAAEYKGYWVGKRFNHCSE